MHSRRTGTRWAVAWLLAGGPVAEAQASAFVPRTCVGDTLAVRTDTTRATTVDTVAPGILYRCVLDRRGPWAMHIVEVDLRRRDLTVDGSRAFGAFQGRETVSDMARRLERAGERPLVGLNADFFDLRTGEVENNHVIRGEWVKGALTTDSPHDAFESAHTQFAVDGRGRPLIGRFSLAGVAVATGRALALVGVNYRPAGREGLVLYTPWHGQQTLRDTGEVKFDPARPPSATQARADSTRTAAARAAQLAHEVVLRRIGRRGDTVLYRARRVSSVGGGTAIPRDGAVLSGTGSAAAEFVETSARRGLLVKVLHRLDAPRVAPQTVVGGWPRLLANGANVGVLADSLEGTLARFSSARHPRSAVGFDRDSMRLFLMVVDGRRPWSVGMSLGELAEAMKRLGAWEAMNLDGGGSSALWVRGSVVNVPSDPSGERAVGNALWIRGRATAPVPRR